MSKEFIRVENNLGMIHKFELFKKNAKWSVIAFLSLVIILVVVIKRVIVRRTSE